MEDGVLSGIREKLGLSGTRRPMLVGMAAILASAAVALGFVLSSAAAPSDFEVSTAQESQVAEADGGLGDEIFVHVSGAVCSPGVYGVEAGSRVADAVQTAGGFAEDADLDACNLARTVEDGEHVIIPALGASAGQDTGVTVAGVGDGGGNASSGLVNLNTASASELESLPGIGASTAEKIIQDRQKNGPFGSVHDLTRVSGIGEKKLEALEGLVCV